MPPATPGFDASGVSPSDATVTMRSLRRRFAEAFDQADRPDDVMQARPGGGLSPLEHAAWTAQALEAIGAALRPVLVSEDPRVELPPVDPPREAGAGLVGPGDTPGTVLARLGEVAGTVADLMANVHGS